MDRNERSSDAAKAKYEQVVEDSKILLDFIKQEIEEVRPHLISWANVAEAEDVKEQLKEVLASMRYTPDCDEEKIHEAIEKQIEECR